MPLRQHQREDLFPPGEKWIPGIVLAVGLLLSFSAFFTIRAELQSHQRMEFDWVAHNRIKALKKGIENGLEAVRSVRDLLEVAGPLDAVAFDRYTRALLERYRGIHTLEWVPLVARAERADPGVRDLADDPGDRTQAPPARATRRDTGQPGYFPILYMNPPRQGSQSLGFDYASDPVYRDLLERAWRGGAMTVSGRIPLRKGDAAHFGFQAFQPVYAPGMPLRTEAQRYAALLGFAVGVFRISELANASISVLEPRGVEFLVRDESAPPQEAFLDFYASRLSPHPDPDADYTSPPRWTLESGARETETFVVADRRWSITCAATDRFRSAEGFGSGAWFVLAGGLLLTLLMALFIVYTRAGLRVRLRMAQALRESEQQLSVLFHQSPDIIMTVNRAGEILMVNRDDPCPGRLALIPPRMQGRYAQALEQVFERATPDAFGVGADDGRWWDLRMAPLREEGAVVAAMLVCTDMTEKRMLEAHAMRNARLASLGVLAASVAHEINNPNNAIQFNVSILSRSWGDLERVLNRHREDHGDFTIGGVPVQQALGGIPRLLEGIDKGARRIQGIVGNLKHMARPDAGELDHRVDLGEVLRTALSILQSQIRKHSDDCRLEVVEPLPPVRGNAQQLEQVFINLILNALQSLPRRTASVHVQARLEEEAEFIRVSVADQGCGIPEALRGRVLESFFTTKAEQGGTGLGLSISHRIVENHGGRMEIESVPGQGTEVVVRLPVCGAA